MPYIKTGYRNVLDPLIEPLASQISFDGDLNYAITCLILRHLRYKGLNYTNLNAVMGVLTCVQHEVYRRVGEPYEMTKIEENGDVPEYSNIEHFIKNTLIERDIASKGTANSCVLQDFQEGEDIPF